MDERDQIKSKREEAARARRLSAGLSLADRERMLPVAGRLDAKADALERKLAGRGRRARRSQPIVGQFGVMMWSA